MSPEDREAQEDELLALASIYSEDEYKRADATPEGEIHLCLELPSDFVISIKSNSATNSSADNLEYSVSFLPPIVLNFELPPGYPSTTPPNFILSCEWLSPAQLTQLCQRLDDLWEENRGCVVLFPWIQFLKEETLDYLNIKSPYEIEVSSNGLQDCRQSPENTLADGALLERGSLDRRAIQEGQSTSALVKHIRDFNEAQQRKAFDSKPFLCNICYMDKLGSDCTHFKACQHVYCNTCLKDYFQVQIKDGQVHALNCPEPKCTSVATPAQENLPSDTETTAKEGASNKNPKVKDLVGEQLFSRYDDLLLQSSLDLMTDVVYCPRLSCQAPVIQETEGAMGMCSVCQYAFCVNCKMTFHGISPCKVPEETNVEVGDEDTDTEDDMRILEKTIHKKWNVEWVINNTKPCPGCKAPIEKNDGCNHMTCSKCKQHFCWLCLEILLPLYTYEHFRDSDCH